MIFSPEKQSLYCPNCDGIDCEEERPSAGMEQCPVCGAPLEPGDYSSAIRCPNCDTSLILEPRVDGGYRPHRVLPFCLSKEKAIECIENEFKDRPFIPKGFLNHKALMGMEGVYVPFFLYDYDITENYSGTGERVRTWSDGNYNYTETSYFRVIRDMEVKFERIPADASIRMDDELMDMMEPYDYDALAEFSAKYLSGFNSEIFNDSAEAYSVRSRIKAEKAMKEIVDDSIVGYSVVIPQSQQLDTKNTNTEYALLPVYRYTFRYGGEEYEIFVNGQTGKVAGEAPSSKGLALKYSAGVFGLGALIMLFACSMFNML